LVASLLVIVLTASVATAQDREQKVLNDRRKVEADGFWIYNDLAKGLAEARRTGRPLVVTLRCIPCEQCVKLDEDLVNKDPRVRPLLEQFVRVRLISTNGLDLSLFQFDYDQSFAAFLLNADGTIYGRFGTRSHQTVWDDDVSIEGFGQALAGALELHKAHPANKAELAAKRGPAPEFASPEKYPALAGKYEPRIKQGQGVVQSCIHCHQIGDAQRQLFRERNQSIPDNVLFSYPHPKMLGLILDPRTRATVRKVESGSIAAEAGFREGDEIKKLGEQPLLSIADVQWVLHQADPAGAELAADVLRDGKPVKLALRLPSGWRKREDLSWRASTWELRRMALGGMVVRALSPAERREAGLDEKGMALAVKHVGQYEPHGNAKKAGVQQGDIVVSFDGREDLADETDLIAHALEKRKPDDRVPLVLVRDGKRLTLSLPIAR
jgi:hypothetical protein